MSNARFAMATHALALLAQSDAGYPSAYIAGSVNTGAPFLRRVLSMLVKAGLIEAREGRDGGYRLAQPADRITLADIYRATVGDPLLSPSPAEPSVLCPVGSGMRNAFGSLSGQIEAQVIASLADRTIAGFVADAVDYGITGHRRVRNPTAITTST